MAKRSYKADSKIYAVYDRYDNIRAVGTRREIVEQLGWKQNTFNCFLCKSKKGQQKGNLIIEVEDD